MQPLIVPPLVDVPAVFTPNGGMPAGSIAFYSVVTEISVAQMQSNNTAPITILAAPGVGYVIMPLVWFFQQDTSNAWAALPTLSLRYVGLAVNIGNLTVPLSNAVGGRFLQFQSWANTTGGGPAGPGVTNCNRALTIRGTADVAPGGTVNTPFRSQLIYTIMGPFLGP